jgi:hypothetical protein
MDEVEIDLRRSCQCSSRYEDKEWEEKGLYVWDRETQLVVQVKKQAYLKWLQTNRQEDHILYRAKATKTNWAVKIAHQKSWDRHISEIENDVQGRQLNAYKIMELY